MADVVNSTECMILLLLKHYCCSLCVRVWNVDSTCRLGKSRFVDVVICVISFVLKISESRVKITSVNYI